eukprot:12150067-Alexandrium_andersonii.AAC.1
MSGVVLKVELGDGSPGGPPFLHWRGLVLVLAVLFISRCGACLSGVRSLGRVALTLPGGGLY